MVYVPEYTNFSMLAMAEKGHLELMQFIGLKDKNGKEIYEGDIFDSPAKIKFKVVWYIDGWFYQNVKDEKPIGHLIEVAKDWKIIGNIYENPELIK